MNLQETWQEMTSDPVGITILIVMGLCVIALVTKGIYELSRLIYFRHLDKKERLYRKELIQRHGVLATPIRRLPVRKREGDMSSSRASSGQETASAFIVMRTSKDFDILHTVIYHFIEQYGESIAKDDEEWANAKLDEIHLIWVAKARSGDRESFMKLYDLWQEGLWPDEDREALPTDWDEMFDAYTTSQAG